VGPPFFRSGQADSLNFQLVVHGRYDESRALNISNFKFAAEGPNLLQPERENLMRAELIFMRTLRINAE
jgi:hypothetical protein